MEAKELMIGDWVQNTNHDIGKVIGFQYDTYSEHNAIVISYHSNSTCFSGCKLIQPIPLTAEILKKNGFLIHPSGTITCYNYHVITDDGFALKFLGKEVKCIYVHQLQQALRLCGLKDLADNFIV